MNQMKTAEPKTTTVARKPKANQPFFGKGADSFFQGQTAQEQSSFFGSKKSSCALTNGSSLQKKLSIGQPGDVYEKEADSMADKVVQRLSENKASVSEKNNPAVQTKAIAPLTSITSFVQTKCAACEQEEKLQKKEEDKVDSEGLLQKKPIFESNAEPPKEEPNIQRKSADNQSEAASPSIESGLNAAKGAGNPLPAATREQMEQSFGADFSGVRVHNDSAAVQMSDDLNAQAFTHGNDIYFNSGKYDAGSNEGKRLLAHELTHTVQQGASVHRKEKTQPSDLIQKATKAAKPKSSEVVDVLKGTFNPSEAVKKEIDEAKGHTLDVRIKAGALASEGLIRIKKEGEGYKSLSPAYLVLSNGWLQKVPGLFLQVDIENNVITGLINVKTGKKSATQWLNNLKAIETEIGFGFRFGKLPLANDVDNKLENGTLTLGFKNFAITIGGFLNLKLNFALENMATPVFDGSAILQLKGAEGTVNVDNKQQGKLGGSGSLNITGFKGFSGLLEVKYDAGTGLVDIHGKAAYTGDKLSGSIELVSTDLQTANAFAKDAIKAAGGVENVQNAAPPAAVPAPKESSARGLAGVGQLQFNLTDWFAGTVNVIVDAEGQITVIGKIAPPAEITLFEQKNWDKELFKFEVKAYYGIPVVGNLNLFANISLNAIAKLGPAKIYNIEILGTYSTDPTVQKSIQIAASINISGYAGLRLRAEGGAGIEILSHDLKFGVGVNADVGVAAYADARPTIGWREPGEFYISGTLDLVGQPVLGLGGDFFIEIETPWWSPLSDKKWTWPLFSKQWPLTDPIGLSATLKDYVLGSGKVPEIEFKEPEFDSSKFMTNMVDDNLPDKSGEGGPGKGEFKDDGTAKRELPDTKKPNADAETTDKPKSKKGADTKGGKAKKEQTPDPETIKLFEAAGAKLKTVVKEPVTRVDLQKELTAIEKSTKGIKFSIEQQGADWIVTSKAKKIANPHPVHFAALLTEADKKGDGKQDNIEAAVAEINKEGKEKITDGEVTRADAEQIVADVKRDHPTVIQSISLMDGGEVWDFEYVQKKNKAKTSTPKSNKKEKGKLLDAASIQGKDDLLITEPRSGKELLGYKAKEEKSKNAFDGIIVGKEENSYIKARAEKKDYLEQYNKLLPKSVEERRRSIQSGTEHTKFSPIQIKEPLVKGNKTTIYYGYEGSNEIFEVTYDHISNETQKVIASSVSYHDFGRGKTEGETKEGMNRAHLVPNEVRGTGYVEGHNLTLTSATFNQVTMRTQERAIANYLELIGLTKGGVSNFDITITVERYESNESIAGVALRTKLTDRKKYLEVNVKDKSDEDKLTSASYKEFKTLEALLGLSDSAIVAKLTKGAKAKGVRRVKDVKYVITKVVFANATSVQVARPFNTGPDVFLGSDE